MAFTIDAFTAVPLRAYLDTGDQEKEKIFSTVQTQSRLADLLGVHSRSIMRTEIETARRLKRPVDEKSVEKKTMDAYSRSVVQTIDPKMDRDYVALLREGIGKPTTKTIVRSEFKERIGK